MASFSVRVLNADQEPITGARVALMFKDPLRGITTEEYTDSDGFAYFEGYDEGEIDVIVRGSSNGSYYYRDGDSITITE